MNRYYLHYSSIFDNPDNKYNLKTFADAIKVGGGKRIRIERQNGWSNQPNVVVFSASDSIYNAILRELENVAPFKGHPASPIIHLKNW